ncbi:MAG: aspartate kinase [Fimbriimonadaceae bacterium]
MSTVETAFERPRGISGIEVRHGFAQVVLTGLANPDADRLHALTQVASAGLSIDFVKLTPDGMAFVIDETQSSLVETALESSVNWTIQGKRSIVMVSAVNIRDEEGLISKVVAAAISCGVALDHIGDMHDRVLLVTGTAEAETLAAELGTRIGTVAAAPQANQRGLVTSPAEARSPSSKIKVMKFGGTSVQTPEARIRSALKVVSAKEQGFQPVVVVSAIGRRGEPYATDTLLSMLREIDPNVAPDAREVDLLIACGEILSSVIFAHTLKTLGHSAMAFRGGQAGIRTDGVFGNARIVGLNPVALLRAVEDKQIPVVCGFQGVYVSGNGMPGGELTTLGRGGSDTTASAVGAALQAVAVEIFTDVSGIKAADPDFVPEASTLHTVTYDEVAEIAHLGAKVVHPRAAEIAMKFDIPLWVKSTFSDDKGTEIVQKEQFPGRRVTGVTHTGKLVYLQFRMESADESHRQLIEEHLYDTLAQFNVNLYMVNISPSGTGFAVSRDQYPHVKDVFDGLVVPTMANGPIYLLQIGAASAEVETQAKMLEQVAELRRIYVDLTEGCTMVSLVGHEYMQQAGVFRSVLGVLRTAHIPILQTTDSDYSLSCLVPESELHRAVKILHDEFC